MSFDKDHMNGSMDYSNPTLRTGRLSRDQNGRISGRKDVKPNNHKPKNFKFDPRK